MLQSVRVSPVEGCSRTTTVFDETLPGSHSSSPSGSVFPPFPALQAELGKHCPYSSRPLPLTFHTLRSCFQLWVSTLANKSSSSQGSTWTQLCTSTCSTGAVLGSDTSREVLSCRLWAFWGLLSEATCSTEHKLLGCLLKQNNSQAREGMEHWIISW